MKHSKLHNIKKTGFKTPDGFFKSFEKNLFNKLNSGNTLKNNQSSGFNVPKDYFKTFDDSILSQVKNQDTKVIPLFSVKKLVYTMAVAASVVLIFNLGFNKNTVTFNSLETASIENYLIEESISGLELANLLNEDVVLEHNDFNIYYNDENIEDFLLDDINIEDLETLIKE